MGRAFETIEELRMTRDGSRAYRYSDSDVSQAMAGSWEWANAEAPDMAWVAEPDLDVEDDVIISGAVLDVLWSKAREYDRIMALCVHLPRCECE